MNKMELIQILLENEIEFEAVCMSDGESYKISWSEKYGLMGNYHSDYEMLEDFLEDCQEIGEIKIL